MFIFKYYADFNIDYEHHGGQFHKRNVPDFAITSIFATQTTPWWKIEPDLSQFLVLLINKKVSSSRFSLEIKWIVLKQSA